MSREPIQPGFFHVLPGFFLVHHLSQDVIHPVQEIAHHSKESIKVARVGKFVLADVDVDLQIAPGVHDFHLLLLDVARSLAGVCHDQFGGLLLDRLDLEDEQFIWIDSTRITNVWTSSILARNNGRLNPNSNKVDSR